MELLDHIGSDSRQECIDLLTWLGAIQPATERGPRASWAYNLERILTEVRSLIPNIKDLAQRAEVDLPVLENATRVIDDLEAEIGKVPDGSALKQQLRPNLGQRCKLMSGKMTQFPLYSLLPYLPTNASDIEHYRTYKAAILMIAAELQGYAAKQGKDYSSAIARAANGLRLSVDRPILRHFPQLLKLGLEDAHADLERLRNGQGYPANPIEAEYINGIETLFRFFKQKTGGHLRSHFKREIDTSPDTSERERGKRTRINRPIVGNQQNVRDARKSGLAPGELAGDIEYITHDEEDDPEELPPDAPPQSLARQAMARKRKLEAIERNAQLVPNSPSRLVPWEHATFLRLLKEAIAGAQSKSSPLHMEAIAALAVSFWMSKKLGDAFRLYIYPDRSALPSTISSSFLGYLQSSDEWVIPALRPKGEPKHTDIDLSAAVHVNAFFTLPDLVGASAYLRRLPSWERANRTGPTRAFEASGGDIEAECKKFLKQARALSYERITRARVADTLFLTILDASGDKALASLALARPHRLGDTQLHYTEVTIDRLRDLYATACRTVADNALAELKEFEKNPVRPDRLDVKPTACEGSVGCAIRPKEDSIARVAKELAGAVDAMRRAPLTDRFLVEFSNLYTAYVVLQLQHLTGLRAVNNPIPSLQHIDLSNRLLIASDKDDYTAFNTRLIPLGKGLTTQLQFYLAHRRAVLSRMDMLNPESVHKLRLKRPDPGVFFLLTLEDDKLKTQPAHPSEIYALVRHSSPWFGLPENCQRARIRSRLLDLDCPPQWIDALLGHWSRGEEPWHRFATTALRRICDGLRGHLETIAQADGWRPVRGLG